MLKVNDIVEKAFLKAVDIDDINKEFAKKIVMKLEESVGIRMLKS